MRRPVVAAEDSISGSVKYQIRAWVSAITPVAAASSASETAAAPDLVGNGIEIIDRKARTIRLDQCAE